MRPPLSAIGNWLRDWKLVKRSKLESDHRTAQWSRQSTQKRHEDEVRDLKVGIDDIVRRFSGVRWDMSDRNSYRVQVSVGRCVAEFDDERTRALIGEMIGDRVAREFALARFVRDPDNKGWWEDKNITPIPYPGMEGEDETTTL